MGKMRVKCKLTSNKRKLFLKVLLKVLLKSYQRFDINNHKGTERPNNLINTSYRGSDRLKHCF